MQTVIQHKGGGGYGTSRKRKPHLETSGDHPRQGVHWEDEHVEKGQCGEHGARAKRATPSGPCTTLQCGSHLVLQPGLGWPA